MSCRAGIKSTNSTTTVASYTQFHSQIVSKSSFQYYGIFALVLYSFDVFSGLSLRDTNWPTILRRECRQPHLPWAPAHLEPRRDERKQRLHPHFPQVPAPLEPRLRIRRDGREALHLEPRRDRRDGRDEWVLPHPPAPPAILEFRRDCAQQCCGSFQKNVARNYFHKQGYKQHVQCISWSSPDYGLLLGELLSLQSVNFEHELTRTKKKEKQTNKNYGAKKNKQNKATKKNKQTKKTKKTKLTGL